MPKRVIKSVLMPLIILPRYAGCPATAKRDIASVRFGEKHQEGLKGGEKLPQKVRGETWGASQVAGRCAPALPGRKRGPGWGDFTPQPSPSLLPAHRCLCPQTPPKDLMSFQTAIVLTNLIETSQGVQGLGGEGHTDRATPEAPSGWKSK